MDGPRAHAVDSGTLDRQVLAGLVELVERSMEPRPTLTPDGETVDGLWTFDGETAVEALALIG